jgi:cysteine/glycine-rich protein
VVLLLLLLLLVLVLLLLLKGAGMQFGGAPKCLRCAKSVFANEQVLALGGAWHRGTCFSCENCKRSLQLGAFADHEARPYCKACHAKLFGPKGVGVTGVLGDTGLDKDGKPVDYRVAAAAPEPEPSRPSYAEARKAAAAPASASAGAGAGSGGCPKCGKSVGFAEKMMLNGSAYHKVCVKCVKCDRGLGDNANALSTHEGMIYCQTCFRTVGLLKGAGYGGAVTHST